MDIYNIKQRPVTNAEYDYWWISPPCEKANNPFCHTSCPWFGKCGATEEIFSIDEEEDNEDNNNWP